MVAKKLAVSYPKIIRVLIDIQAAELARGTVEISRAAQAGKKFAHTNEGSPQRNYPGALYGREVGTTVLAFR